jgi:glycosyltransferase involved in cell wall biosynthesis
MDPGSPERRYQALRYWSNELTRPYDLFINFADRVPIHCSAPRGVLIVQFPYDFVPSLYRAFWVDHFASYQLKISNSYYTQLWTRMFWEFESVVVHPPVPPQTKDELKENLILVVDSLGTVRPGKQIELIKAFTKVKRRLPEWSLTIVGEVEKNGSGKRHFETVQKLAGNFGVMVRGNPTIEEQLELINRARIFWLATGLEEDLNLHPEKAMPFSIPLVQSMSAGCVPLVTNSGGLSEIVRHGENGFFWDTTSQLVDRTLELADESLRLELAKLARTRALDFAPDCFASSFLEQLETTFGLRTGFTVRTARSWNRLVSSTRYFLSARR